MAMKKVFAVMVGAVCMLASLLATVNAAPVCDRECLLQILTIYTDAISQQNTSAIPVAPNVRITNNGNVTTLGAGLVWQTPGALRFPYRHAFVDPVTGAATFRATVTNITVTEFTAEAIANPPPGVWWYYGLRLQVVNGLITEIEEIASSTGFPGAQPQLLDEPDRIWDAPIPEDQRATRDELAAIANKYWDTVSGADWRQAPFHPECQRIEMGTVTVNSIFAPGSCGTEFLGAFLQGGIVTNRRVYAIDPIYGQVVGIGWFGSQNASNPNGSVVYEEFKIQDGLLRHIEAVFDFAGQNWSGWGTGRGSAPPS
jgi:hypothetical protein